MNSRLGVTATMDMAALPGVLGCRLLRRTIQVRLGFNFGFRISDFGFKNGNTKLEFN
jgi:hypothetical protein